MLVAADGENSIVVSPGANGLLEAGEVAASLAGTPPGVVLISLEIPLPAAEAAAVAGASRGLTVIVNPAPAQALTPAMLRACEVLVPNEHEVGHLGQPDISSLLAAGVGAVVVTRGGEGADIHRSGQAVVSVAPFAVDVVDTTGAGDAFCGGLAWALAGGRDLEAAVSVANAVGALATRRRGARASLPDQAEVAALLSRSR